MTAPDPFARPLAAWEKGTRWIVAVGYCLFFVALALGTVIPLGAASYPVPVAGALMTAAGLGAFQALRRDSSPVNFWILIVQVLLTGTVAMFAYAGIQWPLLVLAAYVTAARFIGAGIGSEQRWIWR